MEYSQFVKDVKNCIRVLVEDDYEVKVNRVIKNNSIELDGVVFFKEGENISPNIYLNSYYPRYQAGATVEEIANDIISVYEGTMRERAGEYLGFEFTYEEMKDKIIYRMVNYKRNQKLLEEVPHIRFLDLAITFHCLIKLGNEGIGTVRLTNKHIEEWCVTVKDIMKLAIANTRAMFAPKINTMEEVIVGIIKKELASMEGEEQGELEEILRNMFAEVDKPTMYVMSNEIGINGATVMIYENVIKEFSDQLNCDFYILPSSIHEVILVPYEEGMDVESLREMVSEVNGSQVPEEEVLSERVYVYRREGNLVEIGA